MSCVAKLFHRILFAQSIVLWMVVVAVDELRASEPPALLTRYCVDCHGRDQQEAELDLSRLSGRPESIRHDWRRLLRIKQAVETSAMPPADADARPTDAERRQLVEWLQAEYDGLAEATRDDPGIVVVSRLTKNEYRHVLRDLSGGVVLQAGTLLPSEGGAGEGFSNVGEAQGMSSGLIEKYLEAAKGALSHLRVSPASGMVWSATPRDPVDQPAAARKEAIDDIIAWYTGRETPVPSLVLGIEPAESGLLGGVPSVYYGTISWSSKSTPLAPEIFPRAVFDRLFDTTGLARDKSVLDAVLAQAQDVQRRLSGLDRQKLDEFLHGIRDVELRIERAANDQRLEGWRPSLAAPNLPRPPEALPQDVREHMRLMLDLILLAWRMDKTRVATLIFNRDVSHMQFGFLDGVPNEQLHGISHHKENPEKLAAYQRINQFHVQQLAYLLGQMKAIDEGAGTSLLDNVMLLFGSNMFNGDSHDGRKLPLILAGRGGGALRTGRVIDYSSKPEEEQRLCNLHLAVAQRMGLPLAGFGDSTAPLADLT